MLQTASQLHFKAKAPPASLTAGGRLFATCAAPKCAYHSFGRFKKQYNLIYEQPGNAVQQNKIS